MGNSNIPVDYGPRSEQRPEEFEQKLRVQKMKPQSGSNVDQQNMRGPDEDEEELVGPVVIIIIIIIFLENVPVLSRAAQSYSSDDEAKKMS